MRFMNSIGKDSVINKLFKAYPPLKIINDKNNNIIKEKAILRKLMSDEYLSRDNEGCMGFLFVISGNIKIMRSNEKGEETNLYNIGKGDFCHEALSCFLNNTSLNITGKATQDSEICIIPFNIAKQYLLNNEIFLQSIYSDLYLKFKRIIDIKEEARHERLTDRLLKLLKDKNTNIVYATHSELAFELDSSREVISRKLKDLEKQGIVKLYRGKIQIIK